MDGLICIYIPICHYFNGLVKLDKPKIKRFTFQYATTLISCTFSVLEIEFIFTFQYATTLILGE